MNDGGSMELPVRDAKGVALNTASEDELSAKAGLGPERTSRVLAGRPYHSWDDVKRLEGMTDAIVEALQTAGAVLGDVARAVVVPRPEDERLAPEARDVETRGRRI
jgi:hypothetical protein